MGSARKIWQKYKSDSKRGWEKLTEERNLKDGFGPALDSAESAFESLESTVKDFQSDVAKLKPIVRTLVTVAQDYHDAIKKQSGADRKILAEALDKAIELLYKKLEAEFDMITVAYGISDDIAKDTGAGDGFIR